MSQTLDDGRELQFQEMMAAFAAIQARYKGVRGELLEKVRLELLKTKPARGATTTTPTTPTTTAAPVKATPPPPPVAQLPKAKTAPRGPSATPPANMLPSCRMCGRMMHDAGDGTLVCQRGHTRRLAS